MLALGNQNYCALINSNCVVGAIILSEGVSQSQGYAIFDKDKVYYVAKTSPDLKTAITTLNNMLTEIINMFTAVDVGLASLSGVGGAAVNTAAIIQLTLDNTSFGLTKDILL